MAFHHANRWTTAHAATVNVNVNVFSHLLSAAYKMTSGPLHVYLGILVRLHAKHSKPMIGYTIVSSRPAVTVGLQPLPSNYLPEP